MTDLSQPPPDGLFPQALPAHNPDDPVESAVIGRLAANWTRRASVKKAEPDLDDLFEEGRPDYPEHLLPFRDHPTYLALDDTVLRRLLAWAWVAFNKNVMDNEQRVVNPGFALIASGTFRAGFDESVAQAVTQAMVDEQYHTLMHLNAIAVTRRRRGWRMPESALPLAKKARRHEERLARADLRWQRDLVTLAFTTVSEMSINAYLDLMAQDDDVQPINRVTAELHNRDEYCHSSISKDIAATVYRSLGPEHREFFVEALGDGLAAFGANDFTTWRRIIELLGIEGGEAMMRDVENEPGRALLVQDYSGLHQLCAEIGVLDDVSFDWQSVTVR